MVYGERTYHSNDVLAIFDFYYWYILQISNICAIGWQMDELTIVYDIQNLNNHCCDRPHLYGIKSNSDFHNHKQKIVPIHQPKVYSSIHITRNSFVDRQMLICYYARQSNIDIECLLSNPSVIVRTGNEDSEFKN